MVVAMRLARMGARHRPIYRIVVASARAPRDGKFLDKVGTYHPFPDRHRRKVVTMNFDRIKYWLGVGVQPSERVAKLLGMAGILPPYPMRRVVGTLRTKTRPREKA